MIAAVVARGWAAQTPLMRRLRWVCLLALLAASCTAEELDDFFDQDGGMGVPDPGPAGGAGGGAPSCNTIAVNGPLVSPVMLTRALSFAGGTPTAGAYQLQKTEVAAGALPRRDRRAISIAGNRLEFASVAEDGSASRWSATFDTANVDMLVTRSCGPAGFTQTYKYTATADSLLIKSGDILYTYARR